MASWIDDFEGNKLNPKWGTPTRFSGGGQLDGVYTYEVKDSKFFWQATSHGTENGYWGIWWALPVNAIGDIIVEARLRVRGIIGGGNSGGFGISINHNGANVGCRYGTGLFSATGAYFSGSNNYANTAWPGRPSKNQLGPLSTDEISDIRIVRKNNYMFLYNKGIFMGQYAYATAITNVGMQFYACGVAPQSVLDKIFTIDWIKVWPSSVVL